MTNLRVFMLLDRYLPVIGGTELQASRLAKALHQRGYSVQIVTRRVTSDLPVWETLDGIPVRRLGPTGLGHLANVLIIGRMFLYLIFNASRFDVLHVHGIGPIGLATILAGRIIHKPVILKVATAGDIVRGEAGRLLPYYTRFIRRIILPHWLWCFILKRATHYVAMTTEIEAEAHACGLQRSVIRIPNGVDTDRFHPASPPEKQQLRRELQLPEAHKLIVYAGRLVVRKRVDVLLDALPEVLHEFPNSTLVIAGSGENQIDSTEINLRSTVQKRNLEFAVKFIGNVSNLHQYLMTADLFVFPSEQEGMPNVVLEAMACGLPVIASNILSITDIASEDAISLIPVGNASALADAILWAFQNPNEALAKAAVAHSRIQEQFSLAAVASAYEMLYHQVATSPKS